MAVVDSAIKALRGNQGKSTPLFERNDGGLAAAFEGLRHAVHVGLSMALRAADPRNARVRLTRGLHGDETLPPTPLAVERRLREALERGRNGVDDPVSVFREFVTQTLRPGPGPSPSASTAAQGAGTHFQTPATPTPTLGAGVAGTVGLDGGFGQGAALERLGSLTVAELATFLYAKAARDVQRTFGRVSSASVSGADSDHDQDATHQEESGGLLQAVRHQVAENRKLSDNAYRRMM